MTNDITQKIEVILFYLAEPVSVDFLAKTLDTDKEKILIAISDLEKSLENRGLRIILHNEEATLVTAPQFSETIEKIVKETREREMGRAGIETLSIIAYKGPVSRKEIDYIRGVNSQFALRNLMLRGLVERKNSVSDERIMMYNITEETLRYLGLSHISDLPEYENVKKQLETDQKDSSGSGDMEDENDDNI